MEKSSYEKRLRVQDKDIQIILRVSHPLKDIQNLVCREMSRCILVRRIGCLLSVAQDNQATSAFQE